MGNANSRRYDRKEIQIRCQMNAQDAIGKLMSVLKGGNGKGRVILYLRCGLPLSCVANYSSCMLKDVAAELSLCTSLILTMSQLTLYCFIAM